MPITSRDFNATVKVVQESILLSSQLQDSFARDISISRDDPPAGAFGMVHNTSIVYLEILDHYLTHWRREDPHFSLDLSRPIENEKVERIFTMGRFVFIASVSHFEFVARETVKRWPNVIELKKQKSIYLKNILDSSANAGLVAPDELRNWRELIELRNGCVHNNAVFERGEMVLICGRQVTFRPRHQALAHLDLFPTCTNWMLKAFNTWARGFVSRAQMHAIDIQK